MIEKLTGKYQVCLICDLSKDSAYFSLTNTKKREKRCKSCKKLGLKLEKEIVFTDTEKKCSKCQTFKNFTEYNKCVSCNRGISVICSECNTIQNEEYRLGMDIETRAAKKREEYDRNIERYKDYAKNYSELNKEKIKEYKNKWKQDQLENNSLYRLSNNISSLLRAYLSNKNGQKSCEILRCSIPEFKNHIESQFLNWMNWENYGNVCEKLEYKCSWDLDHIIPISYAKTEEEVYLLNHWSNFQPLCSKVNRDIKRNIIPILTNLELNLTTK